MSEPFLLLLTRGREDGGQAAMEAMKLAVSIQAMGREVFVFLTLAGTRWAYPRTGATIHESNDMSLESYFEQFSHMGGRLWVCSPCIKAYCVLDQGASTPPRSALRSNATYVGLPSVAECLMRSKATVF